MDDAELRIGSLFSGVGGLDLGVQVALGGHVAWHAETDPRAVQVLGRHWPDVGNLGDVAAVDWLDIEPVCVLTAGFPCQDLSVAGHRTGLAPGTRSGLWHHVVTAVEALNPCLVVIENVRGLLSTRAGAHALRDVERCERCVGERPDEPCVRALGVLLADLAALGYDANWTCVRASDLGAPHRRARVFLVAWPADRASAEDPDGESRTQRRVPASGETQGRRSRSHPGRRDRAPAAHSHSKRRCQGLTEPEARRRQPHPGLHRGSSGCVGRIRQVGRGWGVTAAHADVFRRERWCGLESEARGRHELADGGHSPARWWGEYQPAIRRWEQLIGRAAPMPTQPDTSRLAPAFVEWMMGLPEGWVTRVEGLSRPAQLRLLGNSVVPHQAAHALEVLVPGGRSPRQPIVLGAAGTGEQ